MELSLPIDISGAFVAVLQVAGQDFSGFDTYGPTAILAIVLFVLGGLFLRRVIVFGSTCELLLAAEREKTAAEAEKVRVAQEGEKQARADLKQVADEFNSNFALVVTALTSEQKERRG